VQSWGQARLGGRGTSQRGGSILPVRRGRVTGNFKKKKTNLSRGAFDHLSRGGSGTKDAKAGSESHAGTSTPFLSTSMLDWK